MVGAMSFLLFHALSISISPFLVCVCVCVCVVFALSMCMHSCFALLVVQ